jgi:Trk K+ transport system NAD-binding subunit
MKLIVVGAGGAARALLRRIGEVWEVTVVDSDPDGLAVISSIRTLTTVEGDGTQREVLDRAGIAEAAAVVAAHDDDEVNLAVCRAAGDKGVLAAAVAAEPERLDDYRLLEAAAFSPDRLAARRIVSLLERRREFSAAIAGGMAEGVDFRVVADSPVRGSALSEVTSEGWLVVSVVRDGRMIVPHGGTVLQTDDLVTVVGSNDAYPAIVEAFTSGVARFPTDFGSSVGVALTDTDDLSSPVAEAAGLAATSAAESITLIHQVADDDEERDRVEGLIDAVIARDRNLPVRTRAISGNPDAAVLGWPLDGAVGLVVVPTEGKRGPIGRRRVGAVCAASARRRRPVLFSRGATRYQRIVVPARDTDAGWAAARAAIDLGAHTGLPLTAVAVVPPLFIAGDEAREEAARAAVRLQDEAAVQGVSVRRVIEQGNPVRVIEAHVDQTSLLVLGLSPRRLRAMIPGITGHLARRAEGSVLVVPVER